MAQARAAHGLEFFEHYKPRALSNLGWREAEPLFEKTRGLKVRPELTTWVYGAWCGHLCSQAELDGELSGRRCWFCGLSTDPTAHHALWECTRSYMPILCVRTHSTNPSPSFDEINRRLAERRRQEM